MTTEVRERLLLMGPPDSGKTYQLIQVYLALKDIGIEMALFDMEDKLSAFLSAKKIPFPKFFQSCLTWEEYVDAVSAIDIKPGGWIGIDRMDLNWSRVQDWYSREKYDRDLAEQLIGRDKLLTKRATFIPRFDESSWQTINANYDESFYKLVYRTRCNIVMTSGIQDIPEGKFDTFGLGVSPRGQKELGHQPHTVFLLVQRQQLNRRYWEITTAKDLPNRPLFHKEELFDIWYQYLVNYVK